jgi:hypothetical protein
VTIHITPEAICYILTFLQALVIVVLVEAMCSIPTLLQALVIVVVLVEAMCYIVTLLQEKTACDNPYHTNDDCIYQI